mgnify:FL=1
MEFDSGGDGSHYNKDYMSDKKAKKIIIVIICFLLILPVLAYVFS